MRCPWLQTRESAGLVTLVIGVGNLLLALLLAGVFGWGLNGLAAAGAITLTVRHLLFTPLYGARVLNRPYGTFFRGSFLFPWQRWRPSGCADSFYGMADFELAGVGDGGLGSLVIIHGVVYFLITPEERLALKSSVALSRNKA